ncbi:MAG: c-type cytochrome [Geminicoccaceae bacterium]
MTRRKLMLAGLVLPAALAAAAFLFAWSGLYSVAASNGHWPITAWLLQVGMERSVTAHAAEIEPPPDLAEPRLVESAAGHFALGCAPCHGAPGVPPSRVTQQMLPAPPDLTQAVPKWEAKELFWIALHGIKYAGMPAWPAQARADEVWAMTAFLLQLPEMTPDRFGALSSLAGGTPEVNAGTLPPVLPAADPSLCARCHGRDGGGSPSGGVPRLAGQKRDYLRTTLQDYRSEARPSGVMGPVAVFLEDADIERLAGYYSALEAPRGPAPEADATRVEAGRALAAMGDRRSGIPACSGCHGADGRAGDRLPAYPALAGQHAPYLVQQLRLWRAGIRGGRHGNLMTAAAANLSDGQIAAVASYFAGLRLDEGLPRGQAAGSP